MSDLLSSTEPYLDFRTKLNVFNELMRFSEIKEVITEGVEITEITIDDTGLVTNILKTGDKIMVIADDTMEAVEIEIADNYTTDTPKILSISAQTFANTIPVGSKLYFTMLSILKKLNVT